MRRLPVVTLLAALAVSWAWLPAAASDVSFVAGRDRVTKRVKSFKEIREEGVVLQKLDYSCGAAAMATLMSSFFQEPVREDEVVGFIFIHGQTPEEGLKKYFKRKGFSLLDLKRYAEFKGYKAAGYKEMTLEDLIEVLRDQQVPPLVPINPFGYNHFVIVSGIQGDRIYLADPAIGKTTMRIERFLDLWVDGVGFVVTRRQTAELRMASASDEELSLLTAAGDPGRPTVAGAAHQPGPLLGTSGYAVPDVPRLFPFYVMRQAPRGRSNPLPILTDERGKEILGFFRLPRYNPRIQLGRPEGNFIDFTPPAGGSVNIR